MSTEDGKQQVAATREHLATERGEVELVQIPEGSFEMGSPEAEGGRSDDEGPQHRVTVPAFQMGRYAVTNEQYARFLAAHPDAAEPGFWSNSDLSQARQPVCGISWKEARCFANWVEGRLPSEAEWEYAARAGTTAPHLTGSTGADLDRFGWYQENSEARLHSVGEKESNAWGLYDVLGNAWEWVEDDWQDDYERAPDDGSSWVDEPRGGRRVLRGGSFHDYAYWVRAASRRWCDSNLRDHDVGFRVVVSPPPRCDI